MSLESLAHFGNYSPESFGWGGFNDPRRNPDVLEPFSFDGVSFGSMNKHVVPLFTAILTELVPHIKDGLHVNKCGCYNRASVTVDGSRSFHTYGIAIDVNWDSNPMANTNPTDPGDLPAITHAIARKYGCEWGGDWTVPKDWMHIECHLSPGDAGDVKGYEDMLSPEAIAQIREVVQQEAGKSVLNAVVDLGDPAKDASVGRILRTWHGWLQSLISTKSS